VDAEKAPMAAGARSQRLPPHMRALSWIESELDYETQPGAPKCKPCECGKECRNLYCADCWRQILKEVLKTAP
jgi:hypothetical protein